MTTSGLVADATFYGLERHFTGKVHDVVLTNVGKVCIWYHFIDGKQVSEDEWATFEQYDHDHVRTTLV